MRGRTTQITNRHKYQNISDEIREGLKVKIEEAIEGDFNGAFSIDVNEMEDSYIVHTVYGWLQRRFIGPLLRLYAKDPVRAIEIAQMVIEYVDRTAMLAIDYKSSNKIARDKYHMLKYDHSHADVMLRNALSENNEYVACHVPVKACRQNEIEDTTIAVAKSLSTKPLGCLSYCSPTYT